MSTGTIFVRLIDPSLRLASGDDPGDFLCVPTLAPYVPGGLVAAGSVIEVPADIGGTPPTWRACTAVDTAPADPWTRYRDGVNGREIWDFGTGLLAQDTLWQSYVTPETEGM